jgi:hypothetical protein
VVLFVTFDQEEEAQSVSIWPRTLSFANDPCVPTVKIRAPTAKKSETTRKRKRKDSPLAVEGGTILTMMTAIATKTTKHRTTVIWKKLVMRE